MGLQLDVITQLLEALRQSNGAEVVLEQVRRLAVLEVSPPQSSPGDHAHAEAQLGPAEWVAREGYAVFDRVAAESVTATLRRAALALVAAGLPAVFIFMLDEAWSLSHSLRERLRASIAEDYDLLDDGWAWAISPGVGRGWPPHRGGGLRLFTRRAPELVTVWVALGDVAADQACMHAVPLDQDPGYPDQLERLDAPLDAVRALPIPAGAALVWNANLLHWGGGCSPRAAKPRVSCSFSFGRASARPALDLEVLEPTGLDPGRRLDMIANQLAMYGAGQPDVAPELLRWARANRQLRDSFTRP